MGLYRPQSTKAKLAAAATRMFCRLRLHGMALPRIPGKSDETGVLICNPCHGTRIIAVRMRASGRFEILKAALGKDAGPIRREHAVIERLNREPNHKIPESNTSHINEDKWLCRRPGIPDIGPLVERDGAVWFSMPYLYEAFHCIDPVPLLRSWETDIREADSENGLIRALLPLLDEPTRSALAGKMVRRALVHGDFAPWNWRADEAGNLVCIDWEWAREDGFIGFDLVYCLVQQALLVKKVPESRLLDFVRCRVSRLGPEGQAYLREAGLPLDILFSLVLAYRQSKGMNEPSHGGGTPPSPSGRAAPVGQGPTGAALPRFLALEGADGVGKSTVLRLLVPELVRRGGFNGYLFFHWKPVKGNLSYDTIPGDDPHDPRGKEPRNPLASLVFLAHHWLDFQLGYWRYIRPAIREGRLVVADRYTYDVLLDPKRFRLKLPTWILRLFVRTIPRPDRAILLHADPAVIRSRKPELSKSEIASYQAALLDCPPIRNSILIDANRKPKEIVGEVIRLVAETTEQ